MVSSTNSHSNPAQNIGVPQHKPVEPFPPRYSWLKRLAAAAGLLLVALFAPRLLWGHEANRRLQAEIALGQ